MKLVIDMNLPPEWVPFLHAHGFEAVHWSTLGAGDASDGEILRWAREHRCAVFTHDLDFGVLLAHSRDGGPSVIQVRTQDVTPERIGTLFVRAVQAHRDALEAGALITVDEARSRVRVLPI
ncbi:MAG TPA: DUF5615 family PIN-like protein [Verrucomicrobiota bacterium]|nr:DUF5615 family PIN-like protein [Verrucomicrobiota bacterium]